MLRRVLFQIHCWTGIAVGLYVVVVCATGSLLVFRVEFYEYFRPGTFITQRANRLNEEQLTEKRVPYEVGMARFSEIARGQIAGDHSGMLKLLFHREARKLLGVHVIGECSTEIVHIGQAVMALGGTIDYFRDTVFNYPTLAEAYKVAALNGMNKVA